MLATLLAAAVSCAVMDEGDGFYYAVCKGNQELMQSYLTRHVEKNLLGGFCLAYPEDDPQNGEVHFMVVCE